MQVTPRTVVRALVALGAAGSMLVGAAAGDARGLPVALLTWSPPTNGFGLFGGGFDFGAVYPGQTATQNFTLTNRGGVATDPLSVTLSGSPAFTVTSDGCSGALLGAGRSCVVAVEFAPAAAGKSGTAMLLARARRALFPASVTLTGPPDVEIAPVTTQSATAPAGENVYSYDFGRGPIASQTFTVTNDGNSTVRRLSLVPGTGTAFAETGNTCTGGWLAPGQACSFTVTYTSDASCYPVGDAQTFDLRGFPTMELARLTVTGECPVMMT